MFPHTHITRDACSPTMALVICFPASFSVFYSYHVQHPRLNLSAADILRLASYTAAAVAAGLATTAAHAAQY